MPLFAQNKRFAMWWHRQSSHTSYKNCFFQVWSLKISPRWRHPAMQWEPGRTEPAMCKYSSSLLGEEELLGDPQQATGGAARAGLQDLCKFPWLPHLESEQLRDVCSIHPSSQVRCSSWILLWGQDLGFSQSSAFHLEQKVLAQNIAKSTAVWVHGATGLFIS